MKFVGKTATMLFICVILKFGRLSEHDEVHNNNSCTRVLLIECSQQSTIATWFVLLLHPRSCFPTWARSGGGIFEKNKHLTAFLLSLMAEHQSNMFPPAQAALPCPTFYRDAWSHTEDLPAQGHAGEPGPPGRCAASACFQSLLIAAGMLA